MKDKIANVYLSALAMFQPLVDSGLLGSGRDVSARRGQLQPHLSGRASLSSRALTSLSRVANG
jgi:hypothetical protein